jgi:hypothetical protein
MVESQIHGNRELRLNGLRGQLHYYYTHYYYYTTTYTSSGCCIHITAMPLLFALSRAHYYNRFLLVCYDVCIIPILL